MRLYKTISAHTTEIFDAKLVGVCSSHKGHNPRLEHFSTSISSSNTVYYSGIVGWDEEVEDLGLAQIPN